MNDNLSAVYVIYPVIYTTRVLFPCIFSGLQHHDRTYEPIFKVLRLVGQAGPNVKYNQTSLRTHSDKSWQIM